MTETKFGNEKLHVQGKVVQKQAAQSVYHQTIFRLSHFGIVTQQLMRICTLNHTLMHFSRVVKAQLKKHN